MKYYLVTFRAWSSCLHYEKIWWEAVNCSPIKLLLAYEKTSKESGDKASHSEYAILNVLEITREEYLEANS